MWPQSRSTRATQPAGALRGGVTSRSSSPHASVTGTSIRSAPENTADRMARFAASYAGAVTYERTRRAAACGGTRSGWPTEPRSSACRPRRVRTSVVSAGSSSRAALRRWARGGGRAAASRTPRRREPQPTAHAPPWRVRAPPTAKRVAGQVHFPQADRVEEARHRRRECLRCRRGPVGKRREAAEPRHVERDHLALGGEARDAGSQTTSSAPSG